MILYKSFCGAGEGAECVNKTGTALLPVSLTCLPAQVGNHIDIVSTKWVAQDAGIGAGVDSYFEYLVKGAVMLQDEELLSMFQGNGHSALLPPDSC